MVEVTLVIHGSSFQAQFSDDNWRRFKRNTTLYNSPDGRQLQEISLQSGKVAWVRPASVDAILNFREFPE